MDYFTDPSSQYPIFGPEIECPHCRQKISALTLTDTYLCPRHGAFEADPKTGELVHLQSNRHWRLWNHEWYRQHTHPDGIRFEGGHDGYTASHGLTHARSLDLSFDGRGVAGEDMLLTLNDTDRRRFDKALDAVTLQGVTYEIRFHLHPDVDASLDMGGAAVSMALKSGEIWVFRTDGTVKLSLEPSVYLEKNRLKPRATKQIVLSGRVMEYATRTRWSLAKAQETPIGVRDLVQDTPIGIRDLTPDAIEPAPVTDD